MYPSLVGPKQESKGLAKRTRVETKFPHSYHLHNAIVTIYSQVVHQPSGIRGFWFGVSLLSPLRPILRNGNPLLKFLGNSFTGERILQRPTPETDCN